MNLPNKLTVIRILLVPLFMIFYMMDSYTFKIISAVIFILASLTDWADGYIARKNGLITNFGKFMDPLADKLLVVGALCCMLQSGIVNVWIVMIILAREFIVTGLRLVAASEGVVIAAGKLGKLKTFVQMITIILAIFFGKRLFIDILFYISAFLTALSGIVYIVQNRNLLNFGK